METYTKELPGCYHSMLGYLASLENTIQSKQLEMQSVPSFKKVAYKSYNTLVFKDGVQYGYPVKKQIKGGITVYQTPDGKQWPEDIVWDKILITVYKSLDDFKTKPERAGKYKDSLGGGWYSNVPMYKVNDSYFAAMECTCSR